MCAARDEVSVSHALDFSFAMMVIRSILRRREDFALNFAVRFLTSAFPYLYQLFQPSGQEKKSGDDTKDPSRQHNKNS